ncbi:carboxypeptidase regulatory-like domain-containing protein [Corallincola holothuriorum]|uniref:Carboxypeptidase regulatory-like domain-containing protein n=1 Tax=Corallincola holothuriorum TaxID=2282215 RepID=A0A368NJ08_9GAMM|nr:carboxypeptidase-like regulatory domain-containing protein [Corallincola holothuriorum]RCU50562.1 carboxypeptidase regulatory-like domain-containing protein [Corallincola holothuriorum]
MQTFYPVFESGQVLTSSHLNQLSTWLNDQDTSTRRLMLGIGRVCGLEVTRGSGNAISIGRGCGVTSNGLLMLLPDAETYSHSRSYQLPTAVMVDDDGFNDRVAQAGGLLGDNNFDLWELVTDEYIEEPNKPVATALTPQFLQDKVVLLLLEVNVESLKRCDLNDCSDKGARELLPVRRLLISKQDARTLWAQETAEREFLTPRDLDWQSKREALAPLFAPTLNMAATNSHSLLQLRQLAVQKAQALWQQLSQQLQLSFEVYQYLLHEIFPATEFPNGPWFGLAPVPETNISNLPQLFTDIHQLDRLKDIVSSYNEFLELALQHQGICCPQPTRFPFHLLLGAPQIKAHADNQTKAQPADIDFALGGKTEPIPLRHGFYSSPQLNNQQQIASLLKQRYYRTWLLMKRFYLDALENQSLRITPSRLSASLSQQAIPYYYQLRPLDDLHRNWHGEATSNQRLQQVFGYAFTGSSPHPLTHELDDHDFYRVEGLLGKGLGQAIAALKLQKMQYGLPFSIEPVFASVESMTTPEAKLQAFQLLQKDQTLMRLFKCKTGDLDMLLLLVLSLIFQLLLALLYALARVSYSPQMLVMNVMAAEESTTEQPEPSRETASDQPADSVPLMRLERGHRTFNTVEAKRMDDERSRAITAIAAQSMQSNDIAEMVLDEVKQGDLEVQYILDMLDDDEDKQSEISTLYKSVRAAENSSSLYDRMRQKMGAEASNDEVEETYETVRMIAHTEALMAKASVSSGADFDFDDFDTEMKGLSEAFQAFQARPAEGDGAKLRASISNQVSMLSTLTSSALLKNLAGEMQKRVKQIFAEFSLQGYLNKHPGLAHKCGVPKGGTLVLVYTHRSMLDALNKKLQTVKETDEPAFNVAEMLPNAMLSTEFVASLAHRVSDSDDSERAMIREISEVMRRHGNEERLMAMQPAANRSAPEVATDTTTDAMPAMARSVHVATVANESNHEAAVAMAAPRDEVSLLSEAVVMDRLEKLDAVRAVAPDDPINEWVVVADFCLPTSCCDSDCTDLDYVPKPKPIPKKIKVSGRVVVARSVASKPAKSIVARSKQEVIPHAVLTVVDREEQAVKVKMAKGHFVFTAAPGVYQVTVSAKGFVTQQRETELMTSPREEVIVQLQPSKTRG